MLGLLLHFTLVLVYANQFGADKNKLDHYAQWYVYPFFHQNWNLFVPPPDTNYQLFAWDGNTAMERRDLFSEILLKHQKNRLAGYGSLLLAFANSIHYFEKNTDMTQDLNGPVKNNLYFKMIEHSALNYLRHTRNISGTNIKLILVVENIHSKKTKVYFN